MEWGAAITAFLTLLLWVLRQWSAAKPQRDQEAADEATQQGRSDIAAGNADAVNDRIDRLLSGQGDTAGQSSREITAGRIGTLVRLADSGRSISSDTGTSGILSETKTVTGVILDSGEKVK